MKTQRRIKRAAAQEYNAIKEKEIVLRFTNEYIILNGLTLFSF